MITKSMMPAISVAALAATRPDAVLGTVRSEASDMEALLKQVSQQLDRVSGDVKSTAETALQEARRSGEVSNETKATADRLLSEQTALSKAVSNLTTTLEGLDAKTQELSQHVASGPSASPAPVQSLGQAFVSNQEAISSFAANGAKGSLRIEVANAITTADGSAGGLITHEEERVPVRLPRRRLMLRARLTQGTVGSDLVTYRKQVLRDNQSAMVAEGAASPESSYGWEKADAKVKKISHHTNITEEALADADFLQTEIDTELRYGLDLEEEEQILAGDGTGENLIGLLTEAPAFVAPSGLPDATRIDRLRLAILQVALADYSVTDLVLNPLDWAAIEMQKDADNRYIFANPAAMTTPVLWGKDVIETNTMSAGEWLAGDLAMAATYYDRQRTEVLISSEHDTNFVEDMLTMKARKRVAMAIKRQAAMVKGNFTFA
ncbi:phage major capsid protein [Pseudovibrio exalbescens]|uniref:phage major capsid protein n=1 Tax=Pseudovibrio exalbescens TaxID=197461 RepID=UPI00040FA3D5|nr:phage major capsid protein [Pseudovibrio exalbescens]